MTTNAKPFGKLFPQKYIPVILAAVLEVGSTLRKKTATDREDWLTKRLHKRLIAVPIFRDGPLDINLQPEIPPSDPESNSSKGRLDLRVSCGHGYEVYFVLEAKRLRVQSSSSGKIVPGDGDYVTDGMMRFVTGQYAPYMRASAMLGYVFDGKTNNARSDIDKAVQNRAVELKLKHPQRLKPSAIIPSSPVDETCHDLGEHSFTIYHVFLAV